MTESRLRVDWPACRARGICHELAPELIDLDPWGYPVLRPVSVEENLEAARSAAGACPRQALRIVTER